MNSRLLVINVIIDYVIFTGRLSFYYSNIKWWYEKGVRNRVYPKKHWHTIERVIRRLAEEG